MEAEVPAAAVELASVSGLWTVCEVEEEVVCFRWVYGKHFEMEEEDLGSVSGSEMGWWVWVG